MKKVIKFGLVSILLVAIAALIVALVISFKVVKRTTDTINKNLNKKFQEIVRIPEIVPPSQKSFVSTNYIWEMVTPAKEVTTVKFTHDTGFSKNQDKVNVTLEMQPGSDPSLFNKVLPAVVSDTQALSSVQDLEHPNLGPNDKIGYQKIELTPVERNSPQIAKITWQFDRSFFTKNYGELYERLDKFPQPILKFLYLLQKATITLLSGS